MTKAVMLDPREIESYNVQSGVTIWFLGGASLAIRTKASLMYLDLFTGPPPPNGLTKAIPEIIDPAAMQWADLALATHHHNDHCHRASLSYLHANTSSLFLGPTACNRLYREWGFDLARTRLIAPYESWAKGDVTIHALPANDAFEPDAVCFILEAGKVRVFDGGDTLYFPELAEIGREWTLDIAFLSYASNPPGEDYYLNEEAVLKAAQALHPRILVLKHFDLWVEFAADPMPLVERLKAQGYDARVLKLGERMDYPA